jgi:sugar transferase (PEP-CTERM system associated)
VFLINMLALPPILAGARMACWWLGLYEAQGRRTLVIGEVDQVREVWDRMKGIGDYPLIGAVLPDGEDQATLDVPVLGTMPQLKQVVRTHRIHEVVVALQERRGRLPLQDLLALKLRGVHVDSKDSFLERAIGRLPVTGLSPSALVFADGFEDINLYSRIKTLPDVMAAGILMVVLSPLLALIALLVRLDSPGPALYRQVRVGYAGKLFEILKFRTMRVDAEAKGGARFASVGDSRMTRFGSFLRRSRLDELPQMVNIFKGDMSFVGPRPERPEFVEQLQKEIPYYYLRTAVRPGLTGWAQVRYPYGATVTEHREKLEHDLYYIKNMSLTLDTLIVAETSRVVLLGKGAR